MKRFIAGAICPACKQTDTLFFESKQQDKVYCAKCDYQASRDHEQPRNPEPDQDKIKWH